MVQKDQHKYSAINYNFLHIHYVKVCHTILVIIPYHNAYLVYHKNTHSWKSWVLLFFLVLFCKKHKSDHHLIYFQDQLVWTTCATLSIFELNGWCAVCKAIKLSCPWWGQHYSSDQSYHSLLSINAEDDPHGCCSVTGATTNQQLDYTIHTKGWPLNTTFVITIKLEYTWVSVMGSYRSWNWKKWSHHVLEHVVSHVLLLFPLFPLSLS